MAPRSSILGEFFFRVGIEFLKGYYVGFQGTYVFEQFLFALRLLGKSIPNVVGKHPKFGALFLCFGKELDGKKAKKKEKKCFHPPIQAPLWSRVKGWGVVFIGFDPEDEG